MTDLTAEDISMVRAELAAWRRSVPPWIAPLRCPLSADAADALPALLDAAERDLERRSEAHTLTLCGNCGCGVRPSHAIEIAGKPWCRECVQEWVDLREARDHLRDATEKVSDLLASDKPVPEILVGLAEIGQEQADAEARKKAEMDAIFADCGPAKDALKILRKGLTPERLDAIEAEVEHLKAAPDFECLERLLEVAAKYAPLPWRMTAPGCMADANEAAIRQDCDNLIVAAVNALPWLLREAEGVE